MPVEDRMFYRRQKVMKYYVQGLSQREISYNLDIGLATVERDIKYIREHLIVCNSLSENRNDEIRQ
mgnify:FL=1|jgi:DNA-directed RNA polymerase specialized sigma24 family protein